MSSPALDRFGKLLQSAASQNEWVKLVLAKYQGSEPDLQRIVVRPVQLRNQAHLSFLFKHARRDVTKNHPLDVGLEEIHRLIGTEFKHAHLLTSRQEAHLSISLKNQATLKVKDTEQTRQPHTAHDRDKHRWVTLDRPYLRALGVTTAEHELIPSMSRKWKQINKFIEVFQGAFGRSPLAEAKSIRVADFGCGKGYLTFALHDHLQQAGLKAEVLGVELRQDLVDLCNNAARQLGLEGLAFQEGDVSHCKAGALDVMIALHACDTATDHAIHAGMQAGASIIMCSPCCHKQLRPQLLSPHPLRPILQHGIHMTQEAEMITDGLRALWLEACGYSTQVFEFISLEHTSKNKMILAVKRDTPISEHASREVRAQIENVKDFYGVREHCLEQLLNAAKPAGSCDLSPD